VVVALAGVGVAARRSSRVPPLDALREADVDRRAMTPARWILGPAGVAGGIALLAALPSIPLNARSSAGLGAALLLLTAAALLAPVVIGPLVRLVTWPWRRAATGMLVREGTLVAVRRVASTAAPVLLAVGFTVLLAGTVATIDHVQGDADAAAIPATAMAAPDGTPGLSRAAAAAQPGTYRLTTHVALGGAAGTYGFDAAGVPGAGGLTVDPRTATMLGARTGRRVTVYLPDGTVTRMPVTVRADAPGPVVLPRDVVAAHDPDALADPVQLRGPAVPAVGVRALTTRAYVQIGIDDEDRLIRLFLAVLIGLTAGYTGLAVANTLLMATAARRREFGALRLAGAGTGQVLRVTTAEALLAVAVGTLLGTAVAVVSLTGVQHAVAAELERHVPLVVPWGQPALVTLACAAVALVATAVPVLRGRGATVTG
jgi:putative ABC transport system permease protein